MSDIKKQGYCPHCGHILDYDPFTGQCMPRTKKGYLHRGYSVNWEAIRIWQLTHSNEQVT